VAVSARKTYFGDAHHILNATISLGCPLWAGCPLGPIREADMRKITSFTIAAITLGVGHHFLCVVERRRYQPRHASPASREAI
jgi:hypothetical protein